MGTRHSLFYVITINQYSELMFNVLTIDKTLARLHSSSGHISSCSLPVCLSSWWHWHYWREYLYLRTSLQLHLWLSEPDPHTECPQHRASTSPQHSPLSIRNQKSLHGQDFQNCNQITIRYNCWLCIYLYPSCSCKFRLRTLLLQSSSISGILKWWIPENVRGWQIQIFLARPGAVFFCWPWLKIL